MTSLLYKFCCVFFLLNRKFRNKCVREFRLTFAISRKLPAEQIASEMATANVKMPNKMPVQVWSNCLKAVMKPQKPLP